MEVVMLEKVYKRCYDFSGRDEFKVIPYNCPMSHNNYDLSVFDESEINHKFCFGGFVWIGDKSPVYDIKEECKYYDKDSFKAYDNCIECNFHLSVEDDKQTALNLKWNHHELMDIYSKPGTKVRFIAENPDGYNISKESAKLLKLDRVYTIDHTEVGGWSTEVYLKEFPGKIFNSVWFEKVDLDNEEICPKCGEIMESHGCTGYMNIHNIPVEQDASWSECPKCRFVIND